MCLYQLNMEMNAIDQHVHSDKISHNYGQVVLNIPPESETRPCRYRCPSPLLGATNNLNLAPMPRKRASSFKKPKEKNLDMFLSDEMRPRTSSMPTRNTLKKPHPQQLRQAFLGLNIDPLGDKYTVRAFEMNSKGIIIRRSDSMRSRSTNSVISSEGDFCPLSPLSHTSSSLSRDSIRTSPGSFAPTISFRTRILIVGAPDVGKTALAQQFMTSEYLGGFDTSIGKLAHADFVDSLINSAAFPFPYGLYIALFNNLMLFIQSSICSRIYLLIFLFFLA